MNDENTESTTQSLGETLKQGREAANVSLEQLTKKLKLSVLQLQRLENDEHHLLGPATFVKGYAKSYCREFNLDTTAIMAAFPKQQETFKKTQMQSFSKRTEKEAHDSRLMLVSYVILAIVIGSSALWWWQNSTPLNEQVVTQSLSGFTNNTSSENTTSEPVNIAVQNQAELAGPDELAAETDLDTQQQDSLSPPQVLEQTTTQAKNVPKQANRTQTQPENTGLSTIVMHFNEDSWVEIHDGEGEKVAFGVKKAGYEMTVIGKAPFAVVLGKHQAVEVTLNGESVDISHFPKNRLAKFNLPLAE
ncbi:transcriptional regulator [Pseudoalteromonas sp. A601]|uniref:RodZ domain-containing protein n=1 Tax=Pseudoalteromonas sp. A601 TaxID=1967839 RepID=UPI000B3D3AE6|nr:RodZ domain-containing protein [Pseudoalteromonas sp. A601]OUS68424.1 transcriptional regulator [Pseudoalteromonas sp. A601]